MSANEYIEVQVEQRRCYVKTSDFRLVSGLAAHRTAKNPMGWSELPEDAQIVKVYLVQKWNTGKQKVSPVHAGENGAARTLGPGAGTGRPKPARRVIGTGR